MKKNVIKLSLTYSIIGLIFGGCNSINSQTIVKENQNKIIEKVASYEINYLKEYEEIKKQTPNEKVVWVQPKNQKEECKVYVGYSDKNPTLDESYKLFWDGECKDGYAHGLGREITKANLTDKWQIGIYEKGMVNGGFIQKDNLSNGVVEGEANYGGSSYEVRRQISEQNGDINLLYTSGTSWSKYEPILRILNSPFWNNTQIYKKEYPNFIYYITDSRNNDEATIDFVFSLYDKKNNKKHGWAIEKVRNQNVQTVEYINGRSQILELPKEYNEKADKIINEIFQASNRAINAQNQAQPIKQQYLRKICKESVTVNFMDNEEYKEICDDKQEKELMAKIDAKLQKITQAKIARLEQDRHTQQSISQNIQLQNISNSIDSMNAQQYLNNLQQQRINYSKGIFY